jgi:uncharacterized protein YxeA
MKTGKAHGEEVTRMKRIFMLVVAVLLALSFSLVGFAQEKPATGGDRATVAAQTPEKKAPEKRKAKKKSKKKARKAKKSRKKAAASEPEGAPAK